MARFDFHKMAEDCDLRSEAVLDFTTREYMERYWRCTYGVSKFVAHLDIPGLIIMPSLHCRAGSLMMWLRDNAEGFWSGYATVKLGEMGLNAHIRCYDISGETCYDDLEQQLFPRSNCSAPSGSQPNDSRSNVSLSDDSHARMLHPLHPHVAPRMWAFSLVQNCPRMQGTYSSQHRPSSGRRTDGVDQDWDSD